MKRIFTILSLIILFGLSNNVAQIIKSRDIIQENIDLTNETVLGEITINPSNSGKVIVHFDGDCTSDVGDMITLAASDTNSWGVNDGNVSIQAVDEENDGNSFSHTRVYDVSTGSHKFYAVGHNYVETEGSGTAWIYGNLTVKFYPDSYSGIGFRGISETEIDLTDETVIGQVTINPSTAGTAIVRFDGDCISDVGDRIILAASDTNTWSVNDGSVGLEAYSEDINSNSFSHSRAYDISAGSHTFYAVAHNYVESEGSGVASIYGSLTVEFFPNGSQVGFQGITEVDIDLTNQTVVGQVTLNPSTPGKVLVHFDGDCVSDVNDRIVLAASNTNTWDVNDGNVSVQAPGSDVDANSFSHTRVYDVTAGTHDFYAIAHNYVETGGSGIASIYGSLTAEFFPAVASSIAGQSTNNPLSIYPNPGLDIIFIEYQNYKNSTVNIINSEGQLIKSFAPNGPKMKLNTRNLARGLYFIRIINNKNYVSEKFIKR